MFACFLLYIYIYIDEYIYMYISLLLPYHVKEMLKIDTDLHITYLVIIAVSYKDYGSFNIFYFP